MGSAGEVLAVIITSGTEPTISVLSEDSWNGTSSSRSSLASCGIPNLYMLFGSYRQGRTDLSLDLESTGQHLGQTDLHCLQPVKEQRKPSQLLANTETTAVLTKRVI